MHIGDLVTRKSYNSDINFIIRDLTKNKAILSGLDYRLLADANISDLKYVYTRDFDNRIYPRDIKPTLFNSETIDRGNFLSKLYKNFFESDGDYFIDNSKQHHLLEQNCGKVLHIDGDKFYLKICLEKYKKMNVPAIGFNIQECNQPKKILELLERFKPNILVITGHDSLPKGNESSIDIDDYENSKYFVESVRIARQYNKNYDDLVIFAGGCKSYYEEIMRAGANFASSPGRTLINITDPVYIACKFAKTSIKDFLDIDNFSNITGVGGIETRGQCRKIKPTF